MTDRFFERSLRLQARTAGALYLIITITALFTELVVRGRLIVKGDAAATAASILAHEPLWRLGGVAIFLTLACDVAVAILLYPLLEPASKTLSLLAASFRLAYAAIMGAAALHYFTPLNLLKGAGHLGVFSVPQLQAMALESQRLYSQGFTLALVFFGVHCVFVGWLIRRSTFLPRVLGTLMVIAGCCYVANSFAVFIAPQFARPLFPWILLPAFPAELGLTLWLLVKGVDVQRWNEQAGTTARSLFERSATTPSDAG